ncbi:MAG: hypothetical protein KatS3mg113_0665 [Planctomycetaceae bacterium]|nr:MAG: hypothetical protein KatS3mg113_0665 [Planctomycetaceae bacterium]
MSKSWWRWGVMTAFIGLLAWVWWWPDPAPEDLSSLSNQELIASLDNPRQAIRRAAAGQLLLRAKTVIPDLIQAVLLSPPDRIDDVMVLLEELLLSSDESVAAQAEEALEDLVLQRAGPPSHAAEHVLLRNGMLRHTRALSQVSRWGAQLLVPGSDTRLPPEFFPRDSTIIMAGPRSWTATRMLLINERWTGGTSGLRWLARLFPGEALLIYVDDDAPIPEQAWELVLALRRETEVRFRHQACLGVSYTRDATEPTVHAVVPHSPADRAGIQPGDLLVALNGEPMRHFGFIIRWLRQHRPGEEITVHVRRWQQRAWIDLTLSLTLGTDFAWGACRCWEDYQAAEKSGASSLVPKPEAPQPAGDSHLEKPD